jgi:putative SOS response-associated peptidase YedK
LKDIHDRMPVILDPDDYDLWLDPGVTDPKKVNHLLKPFDVRLMKVRPVSAAVNKVANDGPECAEEELIAENNRQSNLFSKE